MAISISRCLQGILVLLLCLVFTGCSKAGTDAKNTSAFDNATSEIKDIWLKAVAADNTNDYAAAVTSYGQILARKNDLTEAQYQAAKLAYGLLNQRLMDAAIKGDPTAKQALGALRKSQSGR